MERIDRLDFKRLKMLREAARTGSFAAAAEILAYSPSAVSQQMASLERDVGATLFERTSRGVSLTESGRALLRHAELALAQLAMAQGELSAIAELRGGRLRLGSFTSATSVFVARAVEAFRQRHPAVEVDFADGEPFQSLAGLAMAELDIAVIFDFDHWRAGMSYEGVAMAIEDGLSIFPLFHDPFYLICPHGHRLAGQTAVTLDQLAPDRILAAAPWARDLVELSRSDGGPDLTIDISHRTTGFEAFQAFVDAGRGVTFMPALALGWKRESLCAVPLRNSPLRRHIKIAIAPHAARSPACEVMLGLIREEIRRSVAPGLPDGSTVSDDTEAHLRVAA